MAEFEELQLRVTLVDQASQPLNKIEEQYRRLATGPTASHIERFKREGGAIKELTKVMGLEAQGAAKSFEMLGTRAGIAGAAVAAAGIAIYEATKKVAEFAVEVRNVGRFAEELGTSYAHVKNITEQMAKLGATEERTQQNIAAAQRASAEAMKQGFSQMFDDVAHVVGRNGPIIARELRNALAGALTPEDKINAELQHLARIRQTLTENRGDLKDEQLETLIKEKQRQSLKAQGFNDDLMFAKQLQAMSKEQEDRLNKMAENAAEVAKNWNIIWENIKQVKELFLSAAFDPNTSPFPAMLRTAKDITEGIIKSLKGEGKGFWETLGQTQIEHPEGGLPFVSDYSNLSNKAGAGSDNNVDENTKELKRLNEQLYQLINPTDKSGGLNYSGGALGDRASGENYKTSTGDTTGRTAPPAQPPQAPTGPVTATNPWSSGSFPNPYGPLMPNKGTLPGAETLKNPPASTMAPPTNPGGGRIPAGAIPMPGPTQLSPGEYGPNNPIPPNLNAYVRGIFKTESGHDVNQAYSDTSNNPDPKSGPGRYNKNVRRNQLASGEGWKGADYGFGQMNWEDEQEAKGMGMSSELAIQLRGGGKDAKASADEMAQTYAVATYLKMKHPEAVKKLLETGDWGPLKAAHGRKWSGPYDHPGWVSEEMKLSTQDIRFSGAAIAGASAPPTPADERKKVRTTIDKGMDTTQQVEHTGHLQVEVPDPEKRGTGDGGTLFNKTPMQRQIQMQPTDIGPADPGRGAALAGASG